MLDLVEHNGLKKMRRSYIFLLILALETAVVNQDGYSQETYQLPPQDVVDIIDADPAPAVSFSPDRKRMLLVYRSAMPSIDDVARRMLRLAGMRIDPVANSRFQTVFNTRIELRDVRGDRTVQIKTPDNAKISSIGWSHRSDGFVFLSLIHI